MNVSYDLFQYSNSSSSDPEYDLIDSAENNELGCPPQSERRSDDFRNRMVCMKFPECVVKVLYIKNLHANQVLLSYKFFPVLAVTGFSPQYILSGAQYHFKTSSYT